MCLELKSTKTKSKIAKKDIICYKRLQRVSNIDRSDIQDGDEFTGIINKIECSGKISIEFNRIYFCTNHSKLDGLASSNKHGYLYSWVFDNDTTSIIINNKELIDVKIQTPYRDFIVEMGKTYDSVLVKNDEYVNEGLHSYKNSIDSKRYDYGIYVKCIIPKGSEYYEGTFCDMDAYASNKLTYVKIIEDCSL